MVLIDIGLFGDAFYMSFKALIINGKGDFSYRTYK